LAGKVYRYELPRLGVYQATLNPGGYQRYLGINAIVATAALTGGTLNAFMSRDVQDNTIFVAGFAVS
jgi:small basic protein